LEFNSVDFQFDYIFHHFKTSLFYFLKNHIIKIISRVAEPKALIVVSYNNYDNSNYIFLYLKNKFFLIFFLKKLSA
jgi:hypothetical protein